MKFTIELKILIGIVLAAVVMWFVFSTGDNLDKTVTNLLIEGPEANLDHIDPIFTNAVLGAGTYGILSKNVDKGEVPQLFWFNTVDQKVKSAKIVGKTVLNGTEIQNLFSNYSFIGEKTFDFLKTNGYTSSANATALNTQFVNYNVASIQNLLTAREKIPQFEAFRFKVDLTFENGTTKEVEVYAMRAISSATSEPYKHMRWVVSWIS